MDGGLGVALSNIMAVEVADQGADFQAFDGHAFLTLDQPLVNVQLLFPLDLVVHHSPSRCELVIGDHHAIAGLLLQVDCPRDDHIIHLGVNALLRRPAIGLTTLHHHMQGRTQKRPKHLGHILRHLIIVTVFQTPHSGR